MTKSNSSTLAPLPESIRRLRARAAAGLAGFTGVLCVAATVTGAAAGIDVAPLAIQSALLTGIAVAAVWIAPHALATRTTLAACLAGALMLLIGAASPLGDGAVQEAHMLFFVTCTFLLALVCPTSLIVYSLLIVAHHLVLSFVAPALVWHATDLRTSAVDLSVHAGIVVILIGPLLLMCRQFMRSAVVSEAALRDARLAAAEADAARERQANAESMAAEARRAAQRDVQAHLGSALDGIISSVRETAATVGDGVADLAGRSQAVDRSAAAMLVESDESSRRMTVVAAAAEQLAGSVSAIRAEMQIAAESSHAAAEHARTAETTIAGLAHAAHEIEAVVGLISSVASRTNLLALNATIESARAGEAGKGFAVVASEVKQLANQTAHATETITGQIATMVARTHDAVAAIGTILRAVGSADERLGSISAAARHQQEAAAQITENIGTLAENARMSAAKLHDVKREISSVEGRGASLRDAADKLNASVAAARRDADSLLESLVA